CRAKLGKKVLWSLKEETSCIKDLWQLPIILWNGQNPTAATATAAKATAGGDATAPTDGVLEAVKKVQQQQTHVWVYPLKSKGEVAAAVLKEWMPRAQRECGHKVKVIRSDNGGEFIGADFEGELKRKGIQHQLTVPYNPQQNGVAERFNRTLVKGCEVSGVPVLQGMEAAATEASIYTAHCTDASFNSVKADGTSIGGYVCLLGGGAVSWRSKKQNEVGLFSCETEYMALHHGAKEVVWLRRLLEELGVGQEEPTVVFCDNESAVKLAKNACLHGLTKHIRPKWHWVRRLLDKEVRLEIGKTHQQAADIFTKRLAEENHWKGMKLAEMSVH
ncbi:hypothetical protein CLOM_g19542, partial [Closterium sp. NIES-68]